jgi:hypothetical protein
MGRTGVCLEALARINRRSFEIAHAVMFTTGQGWMMAFQAGGPHAQDRGLEAVAYAYREMSFVPRQAHWEKPQGKNPPLVMRKRVRGRRTRRGAGHRLRAPFPPGTPTRACSRRSPPATR